MADSDRSNNPPENQPAGQRGAGQTFQGLGSLRQAMQAARTIPAAPAAAPSAAAPVDVQPKIDALGRAYATGKRKNAVARVWIRPGNGAVTVNNRESPVYFARPVLRMIINQPFVAANRFGQFDVVCTVKGGGLSGQAGAVRHGISKALMFYEPGLRPLLKSQGFLTRDSRVVERKKYGKAKARRSFQFSKRSQRPRRRQHHEVRHRHPDRRRPPAGRRRGEAMTQNIYDDPEFFAGYSRLPRSLDGLDGAPEWPALRAMLPPLRGRRVLDLGCGFGWFCRWARQQGAAQVMGLERFRKHAGAGQRRQPRPGDPLSARRHGSPQPGGGPGGGRVRSGLQLARPALRRASGRLVRGGRPRAGAGRQPGVFGRAPDVHRTHPAGMVGRCGGAPDLVVRRLSR